MDTWWNEENTLMLRKIIAYIVVWTIVSFPFTRRGTGISKYIIPAGLSLQILFFYHSVYKSYVTNELSLGLILLALPIIALLILELSFYAAQKYHLFFRINNLLLFTYVSMGWMIIMNDKLTRRLGMELEIKDMSMGVSFFLASAWFIHVFLTLFIFAFYKSINPKHPIYYDIKFGKYRLSQLTGGNISLQKAARAGLKTLTVGEALVALIKFGLLILAVWMYVTFISNFILR